ncbi:TPA: hypothetical protein ACGJRU_005660 [Pseudomonas aeruginosa]|uniref:hypothetical protein n=1 Tax=Pseudomonas TaxID=286 RepID=UPI00053D79A3|nr:MULTISPECIES: hypothetical protein [Pseudomonas]OWJ92891.1 hypothetical protein B6S59_18200 [Pseudomonas sp. A46]
MKKLKDISIKLYWKTQVAAGSMMMSAMAAASSNPIGVNTSQQFGDSVSNVNQNISGLPLLLLNFSQIAGIFFAYKAWDNWSKVQKGNDPEAKPAKSFGWGIAGVGAYFLPSFLGMGGATLLPGV